MMSLANTIGRLEAMGAFARLMRLFAENFPGRFRRDVVKAGITPLSGFDEMSKGIECFLIALNARFPSIPWAADLVVEQMMEGCTLPYLPVCTQALADGGEGDPSSYRLGYRVIFAVTTDEYADRALRPIVGRPIGYPDLIEVEAICERERGPVKYLADAYRYALSGTETFFLDVSYEDYGNGEPFDFTQDTIDWLTTDWKTAQKILKRCERFNDWIEADMRRVALVVDILRQAAIARRVRVRTNGREFGMPIVDVMNDWLEEDE